MSNLGDFLGYCRGIENSRTYKYGFRSINKAIKFLMENHDLFDREMETELHADKVIIRMNDVGTSQFTIFSHRSEVIHYVSSVNSKLKLHSQFLQLKFWVAAVHDDFDGDPIFSYRKYIKPHERPIDLRILLNQKS